jgi:hypothetical protein
MHNSYPSFLCVCCVKSPLLETLLRFFKKKSLRVHQTSLDGTSRNHLLAEIVLVFANAAIPLLNRLVLAHQNLLGNLVE